MLYFSPPGSLRLPSHSDYLNAAQAQLQAASVLASNEALSQLSFEAAALRLADSSQTHLRNSLRNRKRALSASPYSDIDINAMIR